MEKVEVCVCGGSREKAQRYIKEVENKKEYVKRIEECMMAIM